MPAAAFASTLALFLATVQGPHTSAAAGQAGRRTRAVARTWRGATRAEDAERYLDYLHQTGLRSFRETPGNLGALTLRRVRGAWAEFVVVSLWESEEAIKGFAGAQIDRAVFYPEDARFLVDRDEHVDHFEVVFHEGGFGR